MSDDQAALSGCLWELAKTVLMLAWVLPAVMLIAWASGRDPWTGQRLPDPPPATSPTVR